MSRIPDRWAVTRCVCQRMTFDSLLRLCREYGWNIEELVANTGCGDQCGMCHPYLERMLETGEVKSGGTALLIGFGAGLVYASQVVVLP